MVQVPPVQGQQQAYNPQQYSSPTQGQRVPTEAYGYNNQAQYQQPQYQQAQQGLSKQAQQGPQKAQQPANYQQPTQQQPYKPQQPAQKYPTQQEPSRIEALLNQLRKRLNNEQEFMELTDILKKIFNNIQSNLQVEKYRTIKKGNLLSRLMMYEELAEIIRLGGFEDGPKEMVMRKLDLSRLNAFCDEI